MHTYLPSLLSSPMPQVTRTKLVRKGGKPLSERHMVQNVKQPQKGIIWSCMSYHDFGRIQVVEGTINAKQYIEVVNWRMRPQAQE